MSGATSGSRAHELRTAVILAAGMGTRLAGQHADSPKGFLVVDEKAIVEESVDKLVAAGIERIVIVTGHLSEYYEKLATSRMGRMSLPAPPSTKIPSKTSS